MVDDNFVESVMMPVETGLILVVDGYLLEDSMLGQVEGLLFGLDFEFLVDVGDGRSNVVEGSRKVEVHGEEDSTSPLIILAVNQDDVFVVGRKISLYFAHSLHRDGEWNARVVLKGCVGYIHVTYPSQLLQKLSRISVLTQIP